MARRQCGVLVKGPPTNFYLLKTWPRPKKARAETKDVLNRYDVEVNSQYAVVQKQVEQIAQTIGGYVEITGASADAWKLILRVPCKVKEQAVQRCRTKCGELLHARMQIAKGGKIGILIKHASSEHERRALRRKPPKK